MNNNGKSRKVGTILPCKGGCYRGEKDTQVMAVRYAGFKKGNHEVIDLDGNTHSARMHVSHGSAPVFFL